MVKSAAESVKDRARSTEDSLNVQQIVEKQTKQLQVSTTPKHFFALASMKSFFNPIRSQLTQAPTFWPKKEEWPRLERGTVRVAVECSTDCAIVAWLSVFSQIKVPFFSHTTV